MKTITVDVQDYFADDRFSDAPNTQDSAEEYTVNTVRSKITRFPQMQVSVINTTEPQLYHKLGIQFSRRSVRVLDAGKQTSTVHLLPQEPPPKYGS